MQRLDKGEDVDLSQELDPHAVAGLLKLYFRDLPEPLMTFELYPWFIASMSTLSPRVVLRTCACVLTSATTHPYTQARRTEPCDFATSSTWWRSCRP